MGRNRALSLLPFRPQPGPAGDVAGRLIRDIRRRIIGRAPAPNPLTPSPVLIRRAEDYVLNICNWCGSEFGEAAVRRVMPPHHGRGQQVGSYRQSAAAASACGRSPVIRRPFAPRSRTRWQQCSRSSWLCAPISRKRGSARSARPCARQDRRRRAPYRPGSPHRHQDGLLALGLIGNAMRSNLSAGTEGRSCAGASPQARARDWSASQGRD